MQGPIQPITFVASRDDKVLIPLLRDADEDEAPIADAVSNMANVAYLAYSAGQAIGVNCAFKSVQEAILPQVGVVPNKAAA